MKKALNIAFIILTILIMAVIFIFSMDTGDESGSKSSRVTRLILSIVIKGFDDMSESEKEALIEKHSFIVRKLAHFSEYAALGFMVFGSFYTSNLTINKKRGVMVILSWLLSTIYASTDELHQMFVAGRGPSVRDVMIDSLGALFGVLVFTLIVFFISKYQERRKCQ
ncbi:MAG: VanZ family protein [Candidatus Ornithospirochaeta sp.]